MAHPALRLMAMAAMLLALAACDRMAPAPPLPQVERGDGEVAWEGRFACADCESIHVVLLLERAGDTRTYLLTETFLAVDGGGRFTEPGQWRREGDLVRLQGDAGSVRAFALRGDGSLEPRDPRGRRLHGQGSEAILVPVAAGDAP